MFRNTVITLALIIIATTANAQNVKTQKLTDSIYMLQGRGGNIGVSIGEDGILIIDSDYANMAEPIREAIRKLQKGDITFLVNTHFHGDHTGGNKALAQNTAVIGHTNVRVRMAKGKDFSDTEFRNSLPVITYDDEATIHFNGEDIQLKHYKTGHTDSDTVLYFPKANILHMGDHFFVDRFPFIDIGNGGDVAQYIKNVESILETVPKDVTIIPGHGPLADIDDLKSFLKLLKDTTAMIQKGIDAGKDKKTLQKEGLPNKYASAGTGFVNTKFFIGFVYDSFTR